jgi:hypothetical protein
MVWCSVKAQEQLYLCLLPLLELFTVSRESVHNHFKRSSHLRVGLPVELLCSGFLTKIFVRILACPMRDTYPVNLILLHLITLISGKLPFM